MALRETIFVSYSSKNTRFVQDLVLPRIKAANHEQWFAPKSIGGADDWRMKLLEGLDDCDRVLVIISKESLESDYVKLEIASAAKKLLAKKAKLDARLVHRAILPVKLDVRGPYGELPDSPLAVKGEDEEPTYVDPYLLHPYLTLVNFITVPENEELNRWLDPKTGEYTGDESQFTKAQLESIHDYARDRAEARRRIEAALRNPELLKWGFTRFARLMAWIAHPVVQRVALAVGIVVLLTLLHGAVGMWSHGADDVQISADEMTVETALAAADEGGLPIVLRDKPLRVTVRATCGSGAEQTTYLIIRPEATAPDDPTTPPRPDDEETADIRRKYAELLRANAARPAPVLDFAAPGASESEDGSLVIPVGGEDVVVQVVVKDSNGKEVTRVLRIVRKQVRTDETKITRDTRLVIDTSTGEHHETIEEWFREVSGEIEVKQCDIDDVVIEIEQHHGRRLSVFDSPDGERVREIDHKIEETESILRDLREVRRNTENHPSVKSRVRVLAALRKLRAPAWEKARAAHAAKQRDFEKKAKELFDEHEALKAELARLREVELEIACALRSGRVTIVDGAGATSVESDERDESDERAVSVEGGTWECQLAALQLAKLERAVLELRDIVQPLGESREWTRVRDDLRRQAEELEERLEDERERIEDLREQSGDMREVLDELRRAVRRLKKTLEER